jgi:hypothetical protein
MGEEQGRRHLAAEREKILIRPSWVQLPIDPRFWPSAIPANPEAIAIGARLGFFGMEGLVDE